MTKRTLKCLVLCIIFIFAANINSSAYDYNVNMQEMSYITDDTLVGIGYVDSWYDPDSSNYFAIKCNWTQGVAIIKTTDPENPVHITNYRGTGGLLQDVKVIGNYAYVAAWGWISGDGNRNLYIIPLQSEYPYFDFNGIVTIAFDDFASYTLGSTCDTIPLFGDHTLFATDTHLYICEAGGIDGLKEIAILDVSTTPTAPALVGLIDSTDVEVGFDGAHSVCVIGDTIYSSEWLTQGLYRLVVDPDNDYSVTSWGKILYNSWRRGVSNFDPLLGEYEDSLWIVDLNIYADPCNSGFPDQPESCWTYYWKPSSHSNYVAPNGYLLACDEESLTDVYSNQRDTVAAILRVFNIADFDTLLDTVTVYGAFDLIWQDTEPYLDYSFSIFEMDGPSWPAATPTPNPQVAGYPGIHDVTVIGRLGLVAYYGLGTHILDVSDPTDMVYRAGISHALAPTDTWNHDSYAVCMADNGYIYQAGTPGLYIYRYGLTGNIDQDTAFSGDVYIYDTLTVANGTRLTLNSGTHLYMFEGSLLKVDGILKAIGTSSDSVKFIVLGGDPQPGDWEGIYLSTNAACTLSYCSITKAVTGIDMADSTEAKITNCNISDNSKNGVYVDGGKLYAGNCVLDQNGTGIYFRENSVGYLKVCSFDGNTSAGVIDYKGEMHMTDCDVKNSGTYGLLAYESIDSVRSTNFVNGKYGIRCYGDAYGFYKDCSITHPLPLRTSYYGIYAYQSPSNMPEIFILGDSIDGFDQGGIYFNGACSTSVISNTKIISSGTDGIYYKNTAGVIDGGAGTRNLIKGHTTGLYIAGSTSSPKVRRTKFLDNTDDGAFISSGSWADFGTASDSGQNSFVNTNPGLFYHDLHNANATSLNAIYNYWGEVPPNISQIVNAAYFPYLWSDPLPKPDPGTVPEILPEDFALAGSYPNPFNQTTVIYFNLSSPRDVAVKIYNIMGQEVKTIVYNQLPAGEHKVIWDGRNAEGGYVSSGIYLCELKTTDKQRTLKMTILK